MEIIRFIFFVICGTALCALLGIIVGLFFCWLGETSADREIKKHDAEVRKRLYQMNSAKI